MTEESKKILIVDDEEAIREILGLYIREIGFECVTAEDGEEGLKKIISEDPDVVVSDYTMPKMNGIEFLEKTREAEFQKPFIILTGNGTKEISLKALQLGAYDFLEKPFDADHLMTLFKDAMASSKEMQKPKEEGAGKPYGYDTSVDVLSITEMDEYLDNVKQFAEEFENQLMFCIGSLKILPTCQKKEVELGYLFRTMRELYQNAERLRLSSVIGLSKYSMEIYMIFRTHPNKINPDSMRSLAKCLNSLLNILKALSDPDSISLRSIRNEIELQHLHTNLKEAS